MEEAEAEPDSIILGCFSCSLAGKCLAPDSPLSSVMTTDVITTHPDTPLADVLPHLATVSGLPVVLPGDGRLVGVISRPDLRKGGTLVRDVMTRPPLVAQPHNRLQDAADLMLKVCPGLLIVRFVHARANRFSWLARGGLECGVAPAHPAVAELRPDPSSRGACQGK